IYFLKQVALMPFRPEQLLVMGAHEWERSVAFETCEQTRNQGLPELDLFPDQATQMAQEEFWEGAARRFLEAKNILTVPGWMKASVSMSTGCWCSCASVATVSGSAISCTTSCAFGLCAWK